MNAAPTEYKVKYHRSTHPCVMTLSFLLIAYVIARIAANYTIPQDEKWMADCTIGMFVLGAGFFTIKWMHTVRFTAEEIVFCRLGMVYRRGPLEGYRPGWNCKGIQSRQAYPRPNAFRLSEIRRAIRHNNTLCRKTPLEADPFRCDQGESGSRASILWRDRV